MWSRTESGSLLAGVPLGRSRGARGAGNRRTGLWPPAALTRRGRSLPLLSLGQWPRGVCSAAETWKSARQHALGGQLWEVGEWGWGDLSLVEGAVFEVGFPPNGPEARGGGDLLRRSVI